MVTAKQFTAQVKRVPHCSSTRLSLTRLLVTVLASWTCTLYSPSIGQHITDDLNLTPMRIGIVWPTPLWRPLSRSISGSLGLPLGLASRNNLQAAFSPAAFQSQ